MTRIKKPEFGDAWIQWCEQNADKLPLPIHRIWRHGGAIQVRFAGAHPNLRFISTRCGISTAVNILGECRGRIVEFEAVPAQLADGRWICRLCSVGEPMTFDTLPALWLDHLFAPWLVHLHQLFRPDTWVLSHWDGDSGELLAQPARNAIPKVIRGDYEVAFRACIDPQKLNTRYRPAHVANGDWIEATLTLGPSVTGIR